MFITKTYLCLENWRLEVIFDEPKELGSFIKLVIRIGMKFWEYEKAKRLYSTCPAKYVPLHKAPQKMVWAEEERKEAKNV